MAVVASLEARRGDPDPDVGVDDLGKGLAGRCRADTDPLSDVRHHQLLAVRNAAALTALRWGVANLAG